MTTNGNEREAFAAFLLRMRAKGIAGKELIAAIEATPRRLFIPSEHHALAWSARMLPIECGEAIEGIDMQATIIAALELDPAHRVLEIGTGTGFTAAVMGRSVARVLTLERYKTLATNARQRIEALGLLNVSVRQADGTAGMASEGPFDRIISWAAFEALPRSFVDQISSGGILIAPIGSAEAEQVWAKLTKIGSRFERVDIGTARLQTLMPGIAAAI